MALIRPEAPAGAADWCTHPAGLDVPRVRGTKNPYPAAIRDPRPASCWSTRNRRIEVKRLRTALGRRRAGGHVTGAALGGRANRETAPRWLRQRGPEMPMNSSLPGNAIKEKLPPEKMKRRCGAGH